jgi:hypothetical protein
MFNKKNVMKICAGMLLSPALISFSGFLPNRAAQSYPDEFLISLNFPGSPVYYGAPSRTVGGGVRADDCVANDQMKVTALIPTNNVWTTLSDRPKFLWYVPETTAKTAEFVLIDPDDHDIYIKTIDLNSENMGTIIQETLPEDVSLETGVYTWQFSLICNEKDRAGDIYIQGWVEQVDFQDREQELDELKTTLEKAGQDSLKQAQAYLDAEIFNESISLLAQTRCEHQDEWQGLLNWMGLEELATDSIAQCDAEEI